MKLIIQIPCLNEEAQLPATLADLPARGARLRRGRVAGHRRRLDRRAPSRWPGPTASTTSSSSPTTRVWPTRSRPASTPALKLGADVIVNTDADNQYAADDIPALVAPIVAGEADMVVGDRSVMAIEHFSATKKRLQRLGSWVVRQASGTDVPDATSGFRAYNREAALGLTVVSKFTYTLESLIQAGKSLVAVDHVRGAAPTTSCASRGCSASMWAYVRRNIAGASSASTPATSRCWSSRARRASCSSRPGRRGARSCGTGSSTATGPVTSSRSSSAACCCMAAVQVFALGVIADLDRRPPLGVAAHARAGAPPRAARWASSRRTTSGSATRSPTVRRPTPARSPLPATPSRRSARDGAVPREVHVAGVDAEAGDVARSATIVRSSAIAPASMSGTSNSPDHSCHGFSPERTASASASVHRSVGLEALRRAAGR